MQSVYKKREHDSWSRFLKHLATDAPQVLCPEPVQLSSFMVCGVVHIEAMYALVSVVDSTQSAERKLSFRACIHACAPAPTMSHADMKVS